MFPSIRRIPLTAIRKFANSTEFVGAGTSTGIEHSLHQRQLGAKNKQDFKDYKCIEYLNFNTLSFYNVEESLRQFRVEQPSNKKPDTEPKFKSA